ncbi:MAG: efflux RND transporter permease subunit [Candidatus Mcinerneyibacterium aminivorans]|uniref:Efflux RND transporter permease subunit n=1 Tax=Candidatus Mcinerneyibacterium aminivorans TaxID=2703815 RepID=A0A5D0MKS5_9BACT|nr:MAG: efflux RND transporter permease subunit [Candidatus Mcinerneyibacterium aminivorans]
MKLLKYFTKNKILVNLIIILIIAVGIFSLNRLGKDIIPTVEMDSMIINVVYPGASPSDVEINAVVPIENELDQISGIEEYTSFSIENSATIYVTLDDELDDVKSVKDEVYRNISPNNIENFPEEVENLQIFDVNPKQMEVFRLSITPKNESEVKEKELYNFADKIEDNLQKIEGVAEVRKRGYREREILVNVFPEKMRNYYVSLNNIVGSIKSRNVRSTGGSIQSVKKEQTIVTIGEFQNPMDVKDVIIRSSFEKKRVRIRDIANVVDGFKEKTEIVRVNQKQSVILGIVKKENADVVKTANRVKEFIKNSEKRFPEKFKIMGVEDKSLSITSLLNVVSSNAVLGFLLVVFVLLVFLDFKTSFWTAFGIPLSMLMVFSFMYIEGITLNVITLSAIITVLGMLVDHGIVISEVIYENKVKGMNSFDATIEGVKKVFYPVTVTILTTIAAFLPLMAIKGKMGKVIYVFPVVVTATLIASFFEATVILPNHLAGGKTKKNKKKKKWFEFLQNVYKYLLKKALRYRYLVLGLFIAIFFGTIFISRSTLQKFVLFWDDSSDKIYINLEAAEGTSLETTKEYTKKVENIVLKEVPERERVSMITNIGNHTVKRIDSKGDHTNWSQIVLNLVPVTERERIAQEVIRDLRSKINVEKLENFEMIAFEKEEMGPPTGDPVDVKIVYRDEEEGIKFQRNIEKFLSNIDGVYNIENDREGTEEEIKIEFDYERLAQLGLDVVNVANTVRTAYQGSIATSIMTTEDELDFRVQVDDTYQMDRKFLNRLLVPNNQGRLIRLEQVAKLVTRESQNTINHYNGDRVITINAQVDPDKLTSRQISRRINKKFRPMAMKNQNIDLVMGGEAKETRESMRGALFAFGLAALLIYFLLVMLFNSISQPFMIMMAVPFGIVGALFAFYLHGIPLNFMGIIGIIGLSGVVVNDSVIMVDFINQVYRETETDQNIIMDIIDGAKQRFRPVVLTTVTTVAGLLPTVYGIGGSATMIVPTVMAIAYGLLFATLITLIFIPSIYMVNVDIKKILSRFFNV